MYDIRAVFNTEQQHLDHTKCDLNAPGDPA